MRDSLSKLRARSVQLSCKEKSIVRPKNRKILRVVDPRASQQEMLLRPREKFALAALTLRSPNGAQDDKMPNVHDRTSLNKRSYLISRGWHKARKLGRTECSAFDRNRTFDYRLPATYLSRLAAIPSPHHPPPRPRRRGQHRPSCRLCPSSQTCWESHISYRRPNLFFPLPRYRRAHPERRAACHSHPY